MIAVLETYFGHGTTPGEAIVIALTTIPLLIGLVLWVRKVRFPLSAEFYVPKSSEKYRRFQQVAEGEWPIKIRLKARVPENIRAIDIRFVEKQLFRKSLNASQEMDFRATHPRTSIASVKPRPNRHHVILEVEKKSHAEAHHEHDQNCGYHLLIIRQRRSPRYGEDCCEKRHSRRGDVPLLLFGEP